MKRKRIALVTFVLVVTTGLSLIGCKRSQNDTSQDSQSSQVEKIQQQSQSKENQKEQTSLQENTQVIGREAVEVEQVKKSNEPVEILQDTKFANGYGAEWYYGAVYDPANNMRKGECLAYQDISPDIIYLIPDGDVDTADGSNKYWQFEEGEHKNFTDDFGNFVSELHQHRLCVNHVIDENTLNALVISQYNNYGLKEGDPSYNKKLVKKVSSDKNGTIKFYYNTQNDIRNAAYQYGAKFANDSWPHLLFHQNFNEDYDMAQFERIEVSMDLTLLKANQLSKWPEDSGIQDAVSKSEASIQGFFYLRLKSNPSVGVFVGLKLFTTLPEYYAPILSVDQWGQGFYRTNPEQFGGVLELGKKKTIKFDLKELTAQAIKEARRRPGPMKETKPDDYQISFFQLGWENMGQWECEHELSNLSAIGYPKLAE